MQRKTQLRSLDGCGDDQERCRFGDIVDDHGGVWWSWYPDHDSAFAEIAERWCSTRSWIHPIQAKKKRSRPNPGRGQGKHQMQNLEPHPGWPWTARVVAQCTVGSFPSGVDGWAKISPDPASPDLITHGEYGNQHLGKSGEPTLNQRRVNFKVANVKVQCHNTAICRPLWMAVRLNFSFHFHHAFI